MECVRCIFLKCDELTQIMYIYAFGPYRFPQRHVTGDDCEDTASETAAEWRRIVAERRPWTDPAFPPQKESIDGPEVRIHLRFPAILTLNQEDPNPIAKTHDPPRQPCPTGPWVGVATERRAASDSGSVAHPQVQVRGERASCGGAEAHPQQGPSVLPLRCSPLRLLRVGGQQAGGGGVEVIQLAPLPILRHCLRLWVLRARPAAGYGTPKPKTLKPSSPPLP